MGEKKRKTEVQTPSGESGPYVRSPRFFRVLQCLTMLLMGALVCLPVFVSMTVKPWARRNLQTMAAGIYNYLTVGKYWSFLVYFLGAMIGICMILGAIQKYRWKMLRGLPGKQWILNHWLSLHLFALLILSILSTLLAQDRQQAVWGDWYCHEGLMLYFRYGAIFVTGSWLCRKHIRFVLELLTGVGAFLGILVITQGSFFPDLFFLQDRQSLMFHQYNHFGYFLAICAPLAMGLYLQDEKPVPVRLAVRLPELWLILNAMAVNGTRGSFLAILFLLIGWNIYVFLLKKDRKNRILLIDALFLAVIFFLNTGAVLTDRMLELFRNVQDIGSAKDPSLAAEHVGNGRGYLWKHGLTFAAKKPIFGYGPANLEAPYRAVGSTTSSPHSDLVLIAASMGFPAMLCYISGLAGHAVHFFKTAKHMDLLEITVFAGTAGYFLSSLVGVSIYYTAPYYFMLLGFSYGISRKYMHKNF